MKNNNLLKTAGFMALVTLLAKGLGLVRDSLIAANFATGIAADAFMSASKLPTTLFDMVVGGVISASFIPIYSAVRAENRDEAKRFSNKFVTLIFTISCVICAVGILFSDTLVGLLAPSFSGDKLALTIELTRIMFPMIIFTGLAFSAVGLLQSHGEYRIPSLISLVSNAAIIIYFITLGGRFGVKGLSYTMVLAWALQVAVQVPSLVRFRCTVRPDFKFFDKNIKSAMLLAGPMLISTWVAPLYSIINSRLASGIDGAVATLEYANRLYIMLTGVFSFVVTNLVFPKLADATARGDEDECGSLIKGSVLSICAVILPIMAMFIVLSRPITGVIYEHSNFTAADADRVATVLSCYGVGMIGLALGEVLSKIFFSRKNSKTPMINSVISMVINIACAYAFFGRLGTAGLALAAAAGSTSTAVLNWICLRREGVVLLDFKGAADVAKLVAAAVSAGAVCFGVKLIFGSVSGFLPQLMVCAVSAGAAGAVYIALCMLLRASIVYDTVMNIVKRK